MSEDLSKLSLLELFRVEAETQGGILTNGLLELERVAGSGGGSASGILESLMRAAHSLKGAARIVNLSVGVRVAHAMEDWFVAAQRGEGQSGGVGANQAGIDVLLRGVDLLMQISKQDETTIGAWEREHGEEIEGILSRMAAWLPGQNAGTAQEVRQASRRAGAPRAAATTKPGGGAKEATPGHGPREDAGYHTGGEATRNDQAPGKKTETNTGSDAAGEVGGKAESGEMSRGERGSAHELGGPISRGERELGTGPGGTLEGRVGGERVVRLNAENLNRLLGLAGESLVESRWLRPYSDSMQRLKRMQSELEQRLGELRIGMREGRSGMAEVVEGLSQQSNETREYLADRMHELDLFDRRSAHLSNRLYLEVLRTRMRPFGEGARRFPRMVRDLARTLGKQARLEIIGENTQVDRDILERLETPLAHLLRNAVDHGCEAPEVRKRAGKPAEAVVQLEARHSAGMLLVVVSDDGGGVDPQRLRRAVVEKKLTTAALAEKMTETELLQFLFLPGFTMKETVTEISGRGVGLDVVQNMVKGVRGTVRIATQPGRGMRFQLQLPLTLSVLRTLLVEVGGEPYAIPLGQIAHTLKVGRERIETLEGRQHFGLGEERIGLVRAEQVLESGGVARAAADDARLSVVVLGDSARVTGVQKALRNPTSGSAGFHHSLYGLVVDRFLGERELVVQALDPRLGKVKDISAAALMENGAPVLIVDVDDLVRSIEKLITTGKVVQVGGGGSESPVKKRKRVLAVDDSLTVRELERKLLTSRGYLADVAVDGMDGWNAAHTGIYDLVITDVDMPRMDGIELTALIKKDSHLKSLPVMIVSYKDREEDRMRGLEAGADYYLTKGSFHDQTLLQAVLDLIGEPEA